MLREDRSGSDNIDLPYSLDICRLRERHLLFLTGVRGSGDYSSRTLILRPGRLFIPVKPSQSLTDISTPVYLARPSVLYRQQNAADTAGFNG